MRQPSRENDTHPALTPNRELPGLTPTAPLTQTQHDEGNGMDIIWTGNVTFFVVTGVLLIVGWYVDERWLAPTRKHNRAVAARRAQVRVTQTHVRVVPPPADTDPGTTPAQRG
jgi:hypothetical protein